MLMEYIWKIGSTYIMYNDHIKINNTSISLNINHVSCWELLRVPKKKKKRNGPCQKIKTMGME